MIDRALLDTLTGQHVVADDGSKIGKIADVYSSPDGEGTFVTVTTGLFGTSASFIPLQDAQMDGEDVVVPYDKDLVKGAPRVDSDDELTSEEEDRLYRHYSLADSGGPDRDRSEPREQLGDAGETMTRSEERLRVGVESQETGRVRLRKYIVTENVTKTVPVSHEEVRVERVPLDESSTGASSGQLGEEVQEITLHEQRPVVETEAVAVEEIRLDTTTVTEDETVSREVGREVVDVDDSTDARR